MKKCSGAQDRCLFHDPDQDPTVQVIRVVHFSYGNARTFQILDRSAILILRVTHVTTSAIFKSYWLCIKKRKFCSKKLNSSNISKILEKYNRPLITIIGLYTVLRLYSTYFHIDTSLC